MFPNTATPLGLTLRSPQSWVEKLHPAATVRHASHRGKGFPARTPNVHPPQPRDSRVARWEPDAPSPGPQKRTRNAGAPERWRRRSRRWSRWTRARLGRAARGVPASGGPHRPRQWLRGAPRAPAVPRASSLLSPSRVSALAPPQLARRELSLPLSPGWRSALAAWRSGPIYEARSHHVLMSLCPALAAAAAAQTPQR